MKESGESLDPMVLKTIKERTQRLMQILDFDSGEAGKEIEGFFRKIPLAADPSVYERLEPRILELVDSYLLTEGSIVPMLEEAFKGLMKEAQGVLKEALQKQAARKGKEITASDDENAFLVKFNIIAQDPDKGRDV